MAFSVRYARLWLIRTGLWPSTRLARVACYLSGLDLFLLLLEIVLRLSGNSYGRTLSGWVNFLAYVAVFVFLIVAYRWLKAKVLWRLRNRLIVTYVFIGVIPALLLVTMTYFMLSLFAAQFANSVVTSELNLRLRSFRAVNSVIANELAAQIQSRQQVNLGFVDELRRRDPLAVSRQLCIFRGGKLLFPCSEGPASELTLPSHLNPQFQAIVRDAGKLYLRSAASVNAGGQKLTVVSSEPLDRSVLEATAAEMGEISIDALNVGQLPTATNRIDVEIQRGAPLTVVDWTTGQPDQQSIVTVRTRPSALYPRLFASSDFSQDWGRVLIIIAIVFGVIVILALVIGTRLTRTVTRAIAQLYMATHHINKGDFAYRIPVKSNDQLAALAKSFNSMAESLQGLMREQKEKQRMENELVIAQEVQAQLFPRHISQLPSLEVHGLCRPARTVSGDYYDFLPIDSHRMVMAVGDVSGKGISAALLMATIHSAVRAYTLEGIPILREPAAVTGTGGRGSTSLSVAGVEVSTAALLSLLNQQLYESTPAEKYATLFLGFYDDRERKLTYSNAGHLPPIVLGQNGAVRRLECGGTVVGLFGEVEYDESSVHLASGEIFLAYSDGVTEPENDYGEFGEQRLLELVWENRHLPLAKITELVTSAVDDWIGAKEQPDDVTLVLARAK